MKTIGIIGGMSWESTALYYEAINQGVAEELGGLHSAKIVMVSVDFHEVEALQTAGDWAAAGDLLADAGKRLKAAGAHFIIIATNTMHIVADIVQTKSGLPLLHIADATAEEIKRHGFTTVGLLGTAFTMEKDFYKGRLEQEFDLKVLTPDALGRTLIHDVIYNELCLGNILDTSRSDYLAVIKELETLGAEAVILGCTEIGMLIKQDHTNLPLLDTTAIHAAAAVNYALKS
ncbi:aspartate/glutamate racemase family protein [Kordiimonas aquimaris]|uniref:aspartate/glutamate racemase family protein n=1 Tax=Kordiimonas aquimaris TaxID=707591 RepID=UPI0021D38249|nr:aspartate/glutamate racemase family protein [Kordiimonas aquimaris]